jgi:hypothetical protein
MRKRLATWPCSAEAQIYERLPRWRMITMTRIALWRMITMTRIALAVALAIAVLAAVPASAHPKHCQEDLGYGRTGSFGCGG